MRRLASLCALVLVACRAPGGPDGDGLVIDDRPGSFTWKAVGAGTFNSCAIGEDGQRYCWGGALMADCTPASCASTVRPTIVPGAPMSFDSVSSGGGTHCGIRSTGAAYCWGNALSSGTGSLGDGVTTRSEVPIAIAVPNPVRVISAGYSHTCAVDDQGDAYCWGYALGGTLGRDVPTPVSPEPGKVVTTVKFLSVSAGTTQSCGVAVDDIGHCWGSGYGSLGAGARDTACGVFPSCLSSTSPGAVDGGLRWTMISAGNGFTCGVSVEHRGYCWGAVQNLDDPNPALGTLGTGTFAGSKSPVAVAGDLQFQSIIAGTRHACGLTTTGEAYCWGNNASGELGIGMTGGRFAAPQRVAGGLRFVSLSLADHTCAVSVNRNLYCWGLAAAGRLGNGQSAVGTVNVPVRVLQPLAQ